MTEAALTVVNLLIAAVCVSVGTAKAMAARNTPDTALKITSSVLLHAAVVYLLSAPALYRAVGAAVGLPSLPSLLVSVMILLCVGHAHLLTVLWHPRRRTPDALRRSVLAWVPFYSTAVAAMAGLFFAGDLSGPARPLSFATAYAHVPETLAFELVYLTALVVGIVATVRQCRGPDGVIALPERPELSNSLRLFALAVALDLVYVAGTATAVLAASRGQHRLDLLAGLGSVASSTSALVASWGLAKPALAARAAERRDYTALLPLWEALTGRPRRRGGWWNSRYALTDLVVEILDEIRVLHPWISGDVDAAVRAELHRAGQLSGGHTGGRPDPPRPSGPVDVSALTMAVALRQARRLREQCGHRAPKAAPRCAGPSVSAWDGVPAMRQRAHLVKVAGYLEDPLAVAAFGRLAPSIARYAGADAGSTQPGPSGR
ncbi:DUF6545 domain-containing protein [Streptomyces sp. NPDC006385]|uniref:DUF6545 domain-containing protein n=1 Tax=Streptomyces sp. NPDC006385 TaxID=3156761 RepID=UPI00339DD861